MYFHSLACEVGAVERARPPTDVAKDRKISQCVYAERIERPVLAVGDLDGQVCTAQIRIGAGRRLPNAARGIRARVHSCQRAAGADVARTVFVERIGNYQPGEIDGGVRVAEAIVGFYPRNHFRLGVYTVRNVDDQERAFVEAVRRSLRNDDVHAVLVQISRRGNTKNVEDERIDPIERVYPSLGDVAAHERGWSIGQSSRSCRARRRRSRCRPAR